ncbi:hypothetical protein OOT46_25925 [Aquabacterium sp. A7-Y]|uniref:hypothetical protein n=1 Tax=Aquabacterium sp. A7-Y TaxID=1349605 RepID=UPI00223D8DB5|nr:hypothetical protein [Aquabacterium sp. A7-Y]MCW7541254.1 hypothetical protein [Aquabacterium sp. A7-Y]
MEAASVRDALIAEMLGDIGKLHEAVKELQRVLPAQTEETERRFTRLIGLLNQAGEAYREQIERDASATGRRAPQQLDAELRPLSAESVKVLRQLMRSELALALKDAAPRHPSPWTTVGLFALSGAAAGCAFAVAFHVVPFLAAP